MSDGPRIPPEPPEGWPDDIRRILEAKPEGLERSLSEHNIFPTLARHPELFRAWLPFGGFLLTAGKLSGRDRELLILRTAVRCASPYEWGQHVRISLEGGIDRETIDRVPQGPDAAGWSPHEAALLRAADELHDDARISDSTWEALAETYDTEQLIEATMLIGHYHMLAFALNSLGIELDEGLEGLPS
jgi:4-carboxymuconolactone decarboxylase